MAAALSDAALIGDAKAAKKHGVTTRTLRRWKASADMEVSASVSANVREAHRAVAASWRDQVDATIGDAVEYIRWAAKVPKEPDAKPSSFMVQALAVAIKTVAELAKPSEAEAQQTAPAVINIIEAAAPEPR